MNEPRLIDANEIVEVAERAWNAWNLAMATQDTNQGINKVLKRQELCKAVKAVAEGAPTIDPENLPIVRQLREELERVTKEREAAIADLYYTCACETCALQYTDDCPLGECIEPCSHISSDLINNTPYKWRGIQEVQEDKQL